MNYPAPNHVAETDRHPDWLTAPHHARIYDYWLGGKDHFAADRQVAEEVCRCWPEAITAAQASRAFGRRVTWYAAAGCGIRQFLDIGPGLPAPDSTLEVSQRISPACRVICADNDPVVLAHARAQTITSGPDGPCEVIDADLRDPDALLAQAATGLDFDQAAAVLLLGVLQFIGDADDPAAIIARLADGLAPRSMIAVSSLTADCAPGPVAAGVAAWNARVPAPLIPRSAAEITAMFGDLPLQWPGAVPVTQWRPSLRDSPRAHADMLGAVARIPAVGDHHWRNAALWPAPS
ncbi:MAG: SAM-dependent methyltransferase [Actinomycetota bacterium]